MASRDDYNRNLIHLIYYSRATLDVLTRLDTVFPEILAVSVKRNAEDRITGALLACDGWFLQILEGSHVRVVQTFERIGRDPRRKTVTLIRAEPIGERSFENWSMCGRRLSPTDDAILEVLGSRTTFDPAKLSATSALSLLLAVVKIQAPSL